MIAEILHIMPTTVSQYVKRFNKDGVDGLISNKTHKPGKAPISEKVKNEICTVVCTEKPKGATHWSCRMLAKRFGISHSTVNVILRERKLKPHLVKKFQFSTDEHFEEKLTDVVGLYLNPPENAIVLSVDEKSQIQALERSQPILPLRKGILERQTHDYYRHGTTTLFAAFEVLSGRVMGVCSKEHKAKDFIAFLKKLDKRIQKGKVLHIIVDNYSTHKTKEVYEYLEKCEGRFVLHFIPTHSSWLNMVERWFAEITNKRIRRESWESVDQPEKAIDDFIKHWNKSGEKFIWTKTFDQIQASIAKAKGL